jgi:hypothetical protein
MNKDKNFLQNGEQAFKNGDFSMALGAQVKIGPASDSPAVTLSASIISTI